MKCAMTSCTSCNDDALVEFTNAKVAKKAKLRRECEVCKHPKRKAIIPMKTKKQTHYVSYVPEGLGQISYTTLAVSVTNIQHISKTKRGSQNFAQSAQKSRNVTKFEIPAANVAFSPPILMTKMETAICFARHVPRRKELTTWRTLVANVAFSPPILMAKKETTILYARHVPRRRALTR
jgi:hypothetical protein